MLDKVLIADIVIGAFIVLFTVMLANMGIITDALATTIIIFTIVGIFIVAIIVFLAWRFLLGG